MNISETQQRIDNVIGTRRQLQFSLRVMLLVMFVLAVLFALAFQFPRQSIFAASMALVLVCPLVVVGAMTAALFRLGILKPCSRSEPRFSRFGMILNPVQRLATFLGLWQPEATYPLSTALAIAAITTATIAGMWAAIREIGLTAALVQMWSLDQIWAQTQRLPAELARTELWVRLAKWELCALGRWWLLFGTITFVWIIISMPVRPRFRRESASATWSRLLTFAPWIAVLELTFLIGVWIVMPDVVPEPSTGFVVGIFSWPLWHWDCWLDRLWLIRGAVPTFVVGFVFFRYVLRWHRAVAAVAAICLIPAALTLSIAWTVLYLE